MTNNFLYEENSLPEFIGSDLELDELLSRPSSALVEMMGRLDGDIIILGIAGKMGVSLGHLAARASRLAGSNRRIIGVSRFSNPEVIHQLNFSGVETIPCDFLNEDAVASLPKSPNVIYMAGRKFGTRDNMALTWATNTVAPVNISRHFSESRVVAFSTGCVYPLVSVESGGCAETEMPAPVGEYAQSALARERIFEYYCGVNNMPVCIYRLNYAVDLRYGVLHDIANHIWRGEPVDITVGHFNAIWQGDANDIALRALEHCRMPVNIINVTGPEITAVRYAAETMAKMMGKPVSFTGTDSDAAYLNNAARTTEIFGSHRVSMEQMMKWTAEWVMNCGTSLDKPTHFEVNTGEY